MQPYVTVAKTRQGAAFLLPGCQPSRFGLGPVSIHSRQSDIQKWVSSVAASQNHLTWSKSHCLPCSPGGLAQSAPPFSVWALVPLSPSGLLASPSMAFVLAEAQSSLVVQWLSPPHPPWPPSSGLVQMSPSQSLTALFNASNYPIMYLLILVPLSCWGTGRLQSGVSCPNLMVSGCIDHDASVFQLI